MIENRSKCLIIISAVDILIINAHQKIINTEIIKMVMISRDYVSKLQILKLCSLIKAFIQAADAVCLFAYADKPKLIIRKLCFQKVSQLVYTFGDLFTAVIPKYDSNNIIIWKNRSIFKFFLFCIQLYMK